MPRQVNQAYTSEWMNSYIKAGTILLSGYDFTNYRFIDGSDVIQWSTCYILPGSILLWNSTDFKIYDVDPNTYAWLDTWHTINLTEKTNLWFVVWDPINKEVTLKG